MLYNVSWDLIHFSWSVLQITSKSQYLLRKSIFIYRAECESAGGTDSGSCADGTRIISYSYKDLKYLDKLLKIGL